MGVFRVIPKIAPEHYQTFAIKAPVQTHTRKATCAEVDCQMAEKGWVTVVDLGTELGQKQAYYIKHQSGRSYTKEATPNPNVVRLIFKGGQECFQEHRVSLDRPANFIVKGGDWRGNPRGTAVRRHTKPEYWVEEMQENLQAVRKVKDRG